MGRAPWLAGGRDTNGGAIVGGRSNLSIWFGAELALGLQGVFRISNTVRRGRARVPRPGVDSNWDDVDGGNEGRTGTWYLSPRVRLGRVLLDYHRSLPSGYRNGNGGRFALNMLEARYLLDVKAGNGIGLRIDYAGGDAGLPGAENYNSTYFGARFLYTSRLTEGENHRAAVETWSC